MKREEPVHVDSVDATEYKHYGKDGEDKPKFGKVPMPPFHKVAGGAKKQAATLRANLKKKKGK